MEHKDRGIYSLTSDPLSIEVAIWAQPGSSRTRIVGEHGDPPRLKIQIAASAVEGAANEELVRFLSKLLKADVEILRGHRSRAKSVLIRGLTLEQLRERLQN